MASFGVGFVCIVLLLLPLLSLYNIYMFSVYVLLGNKINGESFFYALQCKRVGEQPYTTLLN